MLVNKGAFCVLGYNGLYYLRIIILLFYIQVPVLRIALPLQPVHILLLLKVCLLQLPLPNTRQNVLHRQPISLGDQY